MVKNDIMFISNLFQT